MRDELAPLRAFDREWIDLLPESERAEAERACRQTVGHAAYAFYWHLGQMWREMLRALGVRQ